MLRVSQAQSVMRRREQMARPAPAPLGPVARELWRKKDMPFDYLLWHLSPGARRVLNGAYQNLTGMLLGCNRYWLAESMSEAIEAAESLGL